MPVITTTFQIITPESAEAGDYEETGFIDEEGHDCTPDEYDAEEGKTEVDLAVEFISEQGPVEASDSQGGPRTWYTQTDPAHDRAFFEQGREETHSFHLKGFTPEQETAIFAKLTAR